MITPGSLVRYNSIDVGGVNAVDLDICRVVTPIGGRWRLNHELEVI